MIDELQDNILFKGIFRSSIEGILIINENCIIKVNLAS